MSEKPITEIDEDALRDQVRGDINLYIPDYVIPSKKPEPPVESDSVTKPDDTPEVKPDNVSSQKKMPVTERTKKTSVKVTDRPVVPDDYDTLFLVPNPGTSRCQTYIDRRHYDLIKRYLSAIAPNMSIAGYINNILNDHIERYWEQIEERYNRESVKPLK